MSRNTDAVLTPEVDDLHQGPEELGDEAADPNPGLVADLDP